MEKVVTDKRQVTHFNQIEKDLYSAWLWQDKKTGKNGKKEKHLLEEGETSLEF